MGLFVDLALESRRDLGVDGRCGEGTMPEESLDGLEVHPPL